MENVSSFDELAPEFRILVNGSYLPADAFADVTEVTVRQDLDAPWMFTLRLVNWDWQRATVTWSEDTLFTPGGVVEMMLGYVDKLETVFVGEITGLEPEFSADEGAHLVVRGYDRSHRLLRGRKTRSWILIKDSSIASMVGGEAGLTVQAEDTGIELGYVIQNNQTDLEFLRARADRIGYEVVVEDKTLHVRKRRIADEASVTLRRAEDLIEFYPRLTTLSQVGSVEVRGWSLDDKREVVGNASASSLTSTMGGSTGGPSAASSAFGASTMFSVDQPMSSKAEADQVALAQLNNLALEYITGEGIVKGNTGIKAGVVVMFIGLGSRFSGRYYVTSATHSYAPKRGYRTAFTVRRNAT